MKKLDYLAKEILSSKEKHIRILTDGDEVSSVCHAQKTRAIFQCCYICHVPGMRSFH